MKQRKFFHYLSYLLIMMLLFFISCEPLVNRFGGDGSVEDAKMYTASSKQTPPQIVDEMKFMTWNIRFGVARCGWFGDSCGKIVIVDKDEVEANLQRIADFIEEVQPDIIFLQEVDILSKRTAYIDQVQWLLDHTYFNYGTYASMWDAQYVPSDGLGPINTGNALLSRWEIKESTRIQLSLRGDQDALTGYFYLRRNLLKTKIAVPGIDDFYALSLHLSAFSTDDTKQKQLNTVFAELENLENSVFVIGGDFNLLPPGAQKLDYCNEDMCEDESFHQDGDDPEHKDGSYYVEEWDWMQPLYDNYDSAVPLNEYLADEPSYFTHSPQWDDEFWDRKLDYLFTNQSWVVGSDSTYQQAAFTRELSDHVPVTVKLEVSK